MKLRTTLDSTSVRVEEEDSRYWLRLETIDGDVFDFAVPLDVAIIFSSQVEATFGRVGREYESARVSRPLSSQGAYETGDPKGDAFVREIERSM